MSRKHKERMNENTCVAQKSTCVRYAWVAVVDNPVGVRPKSKPRLGFDSEVQHREARKPLAQRTTQLWWQQIVPYLNHCQCVSCELGFWATTNTHGHQVKWQIPNYQDPNYHTTKLSIFKNIIKNCKDLYSRFWNIVPRHSENLWNQHW